MSTDRSAILFSPSVQSTQVMPPGPRPTPTALPLDKSTGYASLRGTTGYMPHSARAVDIVLVGPLCQA